MALEVLKNRILADGKCFEGGILKVDKFINHQMDAYLIKQIADEFARRFGDLHINKIITVEASGIAPAVILGYVMNLPVVFAKKNMPSTMKDAYVTNVSSFTKQRDFTIFVSKEFLSAGDHVLFIDDFLAFGSTAKGVIELCQQAGAYIEGMGFIIEKEFQHGREALQQLGISRIESMAVIESLDNCEIKIKDN